MKILLVVLSALWLIGVTGCGDTPAGPTLTADNGSTITYHDGDYNCGTCDDDVTGDPNAVEGPCFSNPSGSEIPCPDIGCEHDSTCTLEAP